MRTPILPARNLRLGEVKVLAQSYRARKGQNSDAN